jgi:LysM repeat protein
VAGCEPNATNDGCPLAISTEVPPGFPGQFKETDVRKQALRAVAASAVAVAGVTAAGSLIEQASASDGGWAALRNCESGGNYATDTGNGYYGAYQFSLQTWQSLGYGGLPSSASPATQDAAAQQLYAEDGSAPWPVCGANLSGNPGPASTAPAPAPAATTASAPAPAAPTAPAAAPAPAAPAGGSTYTVVSGDTLWALAIRYGTTVASLASGNGIPNPNLIMVGQVLSI